MCSFKKIGVVVADADEYRPVVSAVKQLRSGTYSGLGLNGVRFFCEDAEVICLHSGIGKVNAACAAADLFSISGFRAG